MRVLNNIKCSNKLILYNLILLLLIYCQISCNNNKGKNDSKSDNNIGAKTKIKIGTAELDATREVSISNFKIVNSYIRENVLSNGNDELYIIFTFDIINAGEEIFEKSISSDKTLPRVYINGSLNLIDINNISGKISTHLVKTQIFDEQNKLQYFTTINPLKSGKLYHGCGYMKFRSGNILDEDEANLDLIKNNIPFKPYLYFVIYGGTKSDFAKYDGEILNGVPDISDLKDFVSDALKTKKNYYSLSHSNWVKTDEYIINKLLKLKE